MGFVDFTKLSFALSSLAQPFDQTGSIPKCVFVILSQRKAYIGHFQNTVAIGPVTGLPFPWLLARQLVTCKTQIASANQIHAFISCCVASVAFIFEVEVMLRKAR